ncbi:esterase 1 [Crepidotus variabilis]|uniref:Esterase 1 n=1 Tax=Crepidotus variabilis TaxID=179855 RepID=A0A9P6JST2_9AGAR|nr:esterase 1 [Crepidotus variabilis]
MTISAGSNGYLTRHSRDFPLHHLSHFHLPDAAMMQVLLRSLLVLALSLRALAAPEVNVGSTKVTGRSLDLFQQEFFGGIPYAEPPVGSLRFQPPSPKTVSGDTFDASQYGKGCLQAQGQLDQESEDCLTVNIIRPAGVSQISKLPVLFWTYGGSFVNGNSSFYNGSGIVARSVQRGTPIIYVNFNYRLGPLGFPQGQEVSDNGVLNLGQKDQLTALQWIQGNIEAFGGDNSKVIASGESAGAIMTSIQMLNPDFSKVARGAILESGGPASTAELPGAAKQAVWQNFTGFVSSCASVALSNNTLDCLRKANSSEITTAFFKVLQVTGSTPVFDPSMDGPGGHIPDAPSNILASGNFAQIPFISGTNLDEGTLFTPTTVQFNEAAIRQLFVTIIPPQVDAATFNATFDKLLQLYPANDALGSPYGTGNETFGLPAGYKRVAAIQGDISFQSQRRSLSQIASRAGISVYSYLFTQPTPNAPPSLGVFHSSEIAYVYGKPTDTTASGLALSAAIVDYWMSFVTSLDPNDGKGSNRTQWPQYTPQNEVLLQLNANDTKTIPDTYRQEQIDFINSNPPSFRHRRALVDLRAD